MKRYCVLARTYDCSAFYRIIFDDLDWVTACEKAREHSEKLGETAFVIRITRTFEPDEIYE